MEENEETKSAPAVSAASGIRRIRVLEVGSRLVVRRNANGSGMPRNVPGTAVNPFQIAAAAQLALLANNANVGSVYSSGKYFILTADIDLAIHFWVPVAEFKGNFDGQNHTIQNLTINNSGADFQGLFGWLKSGAQIARVGLINANVTGYQNIGALAGRATDATIDRCYSSGIVNAYGFTGGLLGVADTALTLAHSWSSCTVTSRVNSDLGQSGGLVGSLQDGIFSISNSFATGNVTGWENTGGLIAVS